VNSNQKTSEKTTSRMKKNDSFEKSVDKKEKIQIKIVENVNINYYVAEF